MGEHENALLADVRQRGREALPQDWWRGTDWYWVDPLHSQTKSRLASALLAARIRACGVVVEEALEDRRRILRVGLDRVPMMVKVSMTTPGINLFKFQNLRQEGERGEFSGPVACFGITPERAYLWVVPARTILRLGKEQHGSGDVWLTFPPAEPPAALAAYGGYFDQGMQRIVDYWGDGHDLGGATQLPLF